MVFMLQMPPPSVSVYAAERALSGSSGSPEDKRWRIWIGGRVRARARALGQAHESFSRDCLGLHQDIPVPDQAADIAPNSLRPKAWKVDFARSTACRNTLQEMKDLPFVDG